VVPLEALGLPVSGFVGPFGWWREGTIR